MAAINDGGQAFPHGNPTHGGDIGMTLRDYFAGQVLAGAGVLVLRADQWPVDQNDSAAIARDCYRLADALLAERAK